MREQQQTPLISAVKAKDLIRVSSEISQGADLNAQDAEGNTALHLAIITKHRGIIELLLTEANRAENPLNVNVLNQHHQTPLNIAIHLLDTNTINLLTLRHGVNIDQHHNREASPRAQFLILYGHEQESMEYWEYLTMEIATSSHAQAMRNRVSPSPRTSIFHHGHTQVSPVDEHNQLVVNHDVSSGMGMFRTLLERFHTRLGTVPEESNENLSSLMLPDMEVVRPQVVVDHTCCCAWWTW